MKATRAESGAGNHSIEQLMTGVLMKRLPVSGKHVPGFRQGVLLPLLVFFLAAFPAACSDGEGPAEPPPQEVPCTWSTPLLSGTIIDDGLSEISGIAPGRRDAGVFWLHNDSGNEPRVYAVDSTGTLLGYFVLDGASNIDWEDMASVVIDSVPMLLIADIGDNAETRATVEIVVVEEPLLRDISADRHPVLKGTAYRFKYPDAPHNAEAMFFDPGPRDLYIITKSGDSTGLVFRAGWPFSTDSVRTLQKAAEIAIPQTIPLARLVTGADMTATGDRIVVSTYVGSYEFKGRKGMTVAEMFSTTPTPVTMPALRQLEAICYGRYGNALWVTSEGQPAPLYHLRCE